MAEQQDPATQPTQEEILRALKLWDDQKSAADNAAAARANGLGDWLDRPGEMLLTAGKHIFGYDDSKPLIENLKRYADESVDRVATALAIIVPAVLIAEGYKHGKPYMNAQMVKIAIDNPTVLVSGLDWVQKMRISSALATLSETPDGARLVETLRASDLPLDMVLHPASIGGGFVAHRIYAEAANIEARAVSIAATGLSTEGSLAGIIAHELRHLEQTRTSVTMPSRGGLVSPESEVIYNRFIEADAQATATDIAWQLKEQGKPAVWDALMERSWMKQIAEAYEAAVTADPAAAADGRAKRAAFDTWFVAETPAGTKIADVYNGQGLRNIPAQSTIDEAVAQGARPTGDMTAEQYARAGGNDGDNYLTRTGGRALDDPYYRLTTFTYGENQQMAAHNDAYKALSERFNAVAPPPPPPPRPSLSNADVQFILEGDYALRHVSTRLHMSEHFTGEIRGDAIPLTGMGRIILDRMADEGLIPRRNGTNIPELMATHGDAIRARFETALAENIAGSVAMDGSNAASHFMIVKGMENARESSSIGENGYPYGKAGTQTIRPNQVIASMAVEPGDIGRIAAGGKISEIITDRVVDSIRGLRTGDETLIPDVRRNAGAVPLSNGLLDPKYADPVVKEWTLEVLRAANGDVNATKLNALGDRALAADPSAALRAVTDIAKLGRDVPQPLLEAMPRWAETALRAVEATDPAGAFSMAQQISDNLPPGDPLHAVTNSTITSSLRRIAATDPLDALTKAAFAAEYLRDSDPRAKTLIDVYSEIYEVARRAEPAAVDEFVVRQRRHVSPESDYGKLLAEKAAQSKLPPAPVADVEIKPVTGTTNTALAADGDARPITEIEARPIPAGMSAMARVNNAVDGGMGAVGLVQGTLGAISSYQEGDAVGVVVNGANAASGGASVGISVARGLGHEIGPALGTVVTKANIALTVGTGVYQIATEKGNFIDTEADGSHNLGNKGERTVAVVATGVAGVGLVAAGVGTAGVVPAVVAVAVVGDKAIEARRAWKDVDRQIAENGAPQRRNVTLTDGDGSPDVRKFRHIFPEMLEVSKDIRDSELPFKPERDPRTGRIKIDDMRRLALGEDPKFLAEFERALDQHIRRQQQVMKDNDSMLPKWLRFDDGASKYTTAQMILADLQGAKTELGWFKTEQAAWDATHNPSTGPASSRFAGPQQVDMKPDAPEPATRIATTPPRPRG